MTAASATEVRSAAGFAADAAVVRATAIGTRAARALAATNGWVTPIAAFPDAPYLHAGGEIVWIGVRARSLHPRMIVLDRAAALRQPLRIDASQLVPWTPVMAPAGVVGRARLIEHAVGLHRRVGEVAAPRGFGALLVGARPGFPLDLAVSRVQRFLAALDRDDAALIETHGCALLGVGTGLTPSGDDLVGAALFARGLLAHTADERASHASLAQRLTDHAQQRTHAISAALFADLAEGASYGLLHAVVDALRHESLDTALEHVRALVAIGHSSGWDMLTGLIAALTAHAPDRIRIGIDTHD